VDEVLVVEVLQDLQVAFQGLLVAFQDLLAVQFQDLQEAEEVTNKL
jgi:hypothetical protein